MIHHKLLLVVGCLVLTTVLMITCMKKAGKADPRGEAYAGANACLSCHGDIAENYSHNNHFKTSFFVDNVSLRDTTIGFGRQMAVSISKEGNSWKQVFTDEGKTVVREKMDFAFGSGQRATTWAYWKNDQLFQLPLTYLSQQAIWTNSPGFPTDHPYFDRAIIARCMECHTSYTSKITEQVGEMKLVEKFVPASIITGIDCERCHGPGKEHVSFHLQNPDIKEPKFISLFSNLTRQQKLDACASCHSGNPAALNSIFNFKPGDNLTDYYLYMPVRNDNPDVHGMQMQSLALSACFQKSATLTCTTCHDPHKKESNLQVLSAACVSCHNGKPHTTEMIATQQECISCHMPQRASRSLDFNNNKQAHSIPYLLRTHKIGIYNTELKNAVR